MTVNAHLRSMWRHRRMIALVAVAATVVVYLVASMLLSKVYEASAQVSVAVPSSAGGIPADQASVLFASNTVATLAGTTPVLDAAASGSGLGISRQVAASRSSVTPSQTVGSLTVSAKGPTPAAAQALARSLTAAIIAASNAQQSATAAATLAPLQAQIATVKAQIASLRPGSSALAAAQSELGTLTQQLAQSEVQSQVRLTVASPADASSSPVSPKVTTDTILTFIATLIVVAELSAFWSFFHDGFAIDDIEDDVRRVLDLPVLAAVPTGQDGPTDDAFRELRTNLIFLHGAHPARTVAMVGVERGVGRTFCAINLARAVSEMRAKAVLIDADLRQRAVARTLGLSQVPGLSDGLEDPGSLRTHLLDGNEHITVLTAGHPVQDPAGLVGGWITTAVFPLFSHSDLVVLDTAATASHPDALALAPLCDATLLVIDPRSSRRRACLRLLEQLRGVGANPVGVVINRSTSESWSPRRRLVRRPVGHPTAEVRRVPDAVSPGGLAAGDAAASPAAASVLTVQDGPDPAGSANGHTLREAVLDGAPTNGAPTNGAPTNGAAANGAPTNGAATNGAAGTAG